MEKSQMKLSHNVQQYPATSLQISNVKTTKQEYGELITEYIWLAPIPKL